MEGFIEAVLKEIPRRQSYLNQEKVESIYFGGGTPSLLSGQAIDQILAKIHQCFGVSAQAEITLEANPDDLSKNKLKELKSAGVNRLSIGTQSFHEADLSFMKRAHNAEEAIQSITHASKLGFDQLSIDLIYGVPTQTEHSWLMNLEKIQTLGVNHLSCYALTVEKGTPLFHEIKKGKVQSLDEDLAAIHFVQLQEWAHQNKWNHYEISNLCLGDNFAVHNTAYWQGKAYLGIGPAAHSYNGTSRQWNVANIKKYIEGIAEHHTIHELEQLSREEQYHEFLMTALRTQWGVHKASLKSQFPEFYPNFERQVEQINPSWIINSGESLYLSNEGKFYADGIASSLFIA